MARRGQAHERNAIAGDGEGGGVSGSAFVVDAGEHGDTVTRLRLGDRGPNRVARLDDMGARASER
jgi:hypothetical protein